MRESSNSASTRTLLGALRLMRPEQWTKNTFVFAGIVFASRWSEPNVLAAALLAFAAFCAASSASYAFNDWRDVDADRRHPTKHSRPLASGALSTSAAAGIALLLLLAAVMFATLAGGRLLFLVACYLAINATYTVWLKHLVIIDVFCIASGFMLRLMAGTWGIGIPPSDWLVLTGMFITLFLGFSKRRAEWTDIDGRAEHYHRRRVIADYSGSLLDTFLAITATATILCYGLYTLDASTKALHGTGALVYTVPLVTFGVLRYLFLVHVRGQGEDPSRQLLTDRQMLLCAALWVLATVLILR